MMARLRRISLHRGDITELQSDAIVNAANNALWMGAGVAGAIKRAGGKVIEDEAVKKGPIPVGEAVVTGAGALKAKYVIHAAVMGPDLVTDADKIRSATENALRRAEELGVKTVAFPALGTGVGRFSHAEAARVMIDSVTRHLAGGSGLDAVIFVLYGDEAYQAFERELGAYESPRAAAEGQSDG
jgi:O-acetyl-ADP-ribose deacetylase (regulator of RNase III)